MAVLVLQRTARGAEAAAVVAHQFASQARELGLPQPVVEAEAVHEDQRGAVVGVAGAAVLVAKAAPGRGQLGEGGHSGHLTRSAG